MSSELRSSYDRRQSGAAKDFKINPYKTLTKIKIPTIKLSSTGGGSDSGTQLSLRIDAWSLLVPSENVNKAIQALADM